MPDQLVVRIFLRCLSKSCLYAVEVKGSFIELLKLNGPGKAQRHVQSWQFVEFCQMKVFFL